MNRNLKNAPWGHSGHDWHDWAVAFEAELRERMKQYEEEGSIGGDIIAQEYKEILGE